jgi:hypothetical protein
MAQRNRQQSIFCANRGQSTVEYVAVLSALFLIAGLGGGAVSKLATTIKQKYKSYCFSVAISDPPEAVFDSREAYQHNSEVLLALDKVNRGDVQQRSIGNEQGNSLPDFVSDFKGL